MVSLTRLLILASLAVLAASGSAVGRAQSSAPLPDGLFSSAPSLDVRSAAAAGETRGAMPVRRVRVATARLQDARLTLNLFPGVTIRAHRIGTDTTDEAWTGRVDGDALSAVTFVHRGDIVQGSIRTSVAAYSVEPVGDGPDHVIRQVDPRSAAVELPPLVPPVGAIVDTPPASQAVADSHLVVDVLVVYTTGARQQAGGSDAAVEARIALGIAETNTAYANSAVVQRVRLVGVELVGYRESGDLAEDLQRLTSTTDGFMDVVHARRNATGADLVALIVGSTAGGACGVAWVMQSVSTGFAPYGFNVTAYPCISPNYTFAHELAHNMGTAHAPEDPNAPPVFPYAYGYKDPQRVFRTVMAYDCIGGCPRVLHFSNPAATFEGKPTGTVDLQDNALALNQTAHAVAGFRPTRPDATVLSAPLHADVVTTGTSAVVSWTRPAAGTPTSYVVEIGRDEGMADVSSFVVNAPATTFVRANVEPGTYHVRVRAHDEWGPGPPSASTLVVMTATGRCVAPAGPPILLPPVVTGGTVSLAWLPTATGGPVDQYVIGAGTRSAQLDTAVIETGSSQATYSVAAAAGVYFVRVAGVNPCGIGPPSNEVGVVVGPPLPGPPAGLVAQLGANGRVTLVWQPAAVGGAPTQYVVEAGSASTLTDVAILPTLDATPSLTVIAARGRYLVRVRAVNEHGSSVASQEITVLVP